MKVNILRTNFATKAICQMQKYFSCQLTPKAQEESQHSSEIKESTTFSVANIEQTSGQEKNFFRWPFRYLAFGISTQTLDAISVESTRSKIIWATISGCDFLPLQNWNMAGNHRLRKFYYTAKWNWKNIRAENEIEEKNVKKNNWC